MISINHTVNTPRKTPRNVRMKTADGQGESDESSRLNTFVVHVVDADVLSELDGTTISHVVECVGQAGCFAAEVTVTVSAMVDTEQTGQVALLEFCPI